MAFSSANYDKNILGYRLGKDHLAARYSLRSVAQRVACGVVKTAGQHTL